MKFDPTELSTIGVDADLIDFLIDEHVSQTVPRLDRLWDYYRNDMTYDNTVDAVGQGARMAQAQGLPDRLIHGGALGQPQREIVIENDIAWRIHTLVDFLFGKPLVVKSCAADKQRAGLIEKFIGQVFELNGGLGFFQDLALLGSIYGHVDILLRVDAPANGSLGVQTAGDAEAWILKTAERFVLEIIEAPRAIPVLNPDDYRGLDAYVLHYRQVLNQVEESGLLSRVRHRVLGGSAAPRRAVMDRTQVWTDEFVTTFHGTSSKQVLVDQSANRLGLIPLVHIQNMSQPFSFSGLSEVEPLISLQNELNTRLSDRANRITFQSFKMYLGKGIEQFTDRPVGPGQMWATDNPDASILEFGGDSQNPSEDSHINEIREAMDKTSAVTPVAAGLLRGRVGNLTSGNALRITLMGLLARTEKKRATYGAGIQRLSELILHAADVHGILPNGPDERGVRLDWPSMLPENEEQRLNEAKLKLDIGVPKDRVLTELGYGDCVDSV